MCCYRLEYRVDDLLLVVIRNLCASIGWNTELMCCYWLEFQEKMLCYWLEYQEELLLAVISRGCYAIGWNTELMGCYFLEYRVDVVLLVGILSD